MKRFGAVFVLSFVSLVLVVGVCGCTSSNYKPEGKSPTLSTPTLSEAGVLKVGVRASGGNTPLAGLPSGSDSSSNNSAKVIGFDVDLAAAIADEFGLKLQIVDYGSDPLWYLNDGKVDIVLGIDQSNASPDLWVSNGYLPTSVALFSTTTNNSIPADNSNPKIGVPNQSMSSWLATSEYGAGSISTFDNLSDAFTALKDGKVTYVAADAVAGSYAAQVLGVQTQIVALMEEPSSYCIATHNSKTEMKSLMATTLQKLSSDGTISVIQKKWLSTTLELDKIALTPAAQKNAEEAKNNAA